MLPRSLHVALILALLPSALPADGPYQWRRAPEGLEFSQGGQPVLFYQLKEKSLTVDGRAKWPRSNYIHPLYDLDGRVMTEDFPADHKHHRGIFWAWHQLKHKGKPLADPWICEGIRWKLHDDAIKVSQHQEHTTLDLRWTWQVNPDAESGEPVWKGVVREQTTLVLHRGTRDRRRLDFVIRLRGMTDDISIGGSENVKGYGGFSTRIKLKPPMEFYGRDGRVEPQVGSVKAGPWLDMVRSASASEDAVSKTHLAIICHPSAPEFPPKWILRSSRSMQNVAWPGRHAVKLPTDRDIVLRYRLLLHRKALRAEELDEEFEDYKKSSR